MENRTLDCDQVALIVAAIGRYLPKPDLPRISRAYEMLVLGLLYEIMEVANLSFADALAKGNATPEPLREMTEYACMNKMRESISGS